MFKHFTLKAILVLALPAVAAFTLATSASASPRTHVSFSASNDRASAGWSHGKGSPIDLTIGTSQASFAEITFHHLAATTVGSTSEPTFSTTNYNAGSPRWYLTLSDGNTLWGYPPKAGLNGSDFAWAVNNGNTYQSWSTIQAEEGGATVTGAFVIADADQSAGTTDVITGLTFNGTSYN